jgi:hypothetical protein
VPSVLSSPLPPTPETYRGFLGLSYLSATLLFPLKNPKKP